MSKKVGALTAIALTLLGERIDAVAFSSDEQLLAAVSDRGT